MKTKTQSFTPDQGLLRLTVAGFTDGGVCLVHLDLDDPENLLPCDLLHTSGQSLLCLATGDTVVVWLPEPKAERGIIMGRVGSSHAATADSPPEKMILAASEELMLHCGESTIVMRGDGKIVLRGQNILSRAERTNRVNGGKVAIN